jgi:hypothetical protein
MDEVIFHLPFRNAEELCKLIGGEAGAGQEFDNPLTGRLWQRQHQVASYGMAR